MTDRLNNLLADRSLTHGDFRCVAETAQMTKDILRAGSTYTRLEHVQREAADAIACKLARIVNGDGDTVDHWEDIAGYARLVEMWLGQRRVEMTAEASLRAALKVEPAE